MDSGSFFSFFHHCRIGDFGDLWAFLIQSMANFLCCLPKWLIPTRELIHNIFRAIQQTSGSGLIRKSGFKSQITFCAWWSVHCLSALVCCIYYRWRYSTCCSRWAAELGTNESTLFTVWTAHSASAQHWRRSSYFSSTTCPDSSTSTTVCSRKCFPLRVPARYVTRWCRMT